MKKKLLGFVLCFALSAPAFAEIERAPTLRGGAIIDVRNFGAVGDGVHDDTAAIQAAITASNSHGTVYLPKGYTFLVSPSNNAYVFTIVEGGNYSFNGGGTIKIKDSVGNYKEVFGAEWVTPKTFVMDNIIFDQNATNNSTNDIGTYKSRLVAFGSNDNKSEIISITNCVFKDINTTNVFFVGMSNTKFVGNIFYQNTTGSVYHDTSIIYVGDHSESTLIQGNKFYAAYNAAGAVTAIETHGNNTQILDNYVKEFQRLAIICGQGYRETKNIVVSRNIGDGTCYGISLWSVQNGSHVSGYGASNIKITENIINIGNLSWVTNSQAGDQISKSYKGIGINFLNTNIDLPVRNMTIDNNEINFDLPTDTGDDYKTTCMGIGYFNIDNLNTLENITVSKNIIRNCPTQPIRFHAKYIYGLHIADNTIINAGSALNALGANYHYAIEAYAVTADKGVEIANNYIEDNNDTSRMIGGVWYSLLGQYKVSGKVTVSGSTTTSYVRPYYKDARAGLPRVDVQQDLPILSSVGSWSFATANSKIFSPTNGNYFYFSAASNSWKLSQFVDAGNVGIGTTAPSTLFQVGTENFNVTSAGNVGIGTTAPTNKFSVAGNFGVSNLGVNTVNSLAIARASQSVLDDGTITLATGVSGMLKVWTEAEYMQVYVIADGTITSIYGSTNTAIADTDTKLCVYDGGTGAVIKNRLGATKTVRYEFEYS